MGHRTYHWVHQSSDAAMLRPITIVTLLLVAACQKKPARFSFGQDVKASFVVVFKHGTTQRQVNRYLDDHLFVKTSATQFSLRPGIRAVVKASVQGHDGYAVTFFRTTVA